MGHFHLDGAPKSPKDIVAPHISNLTSVLATAVPTITDDIKFVLKEELKVLERQSINVWDIDARTRFRRRVSLLDSPYTNFFAFRYRVMGRVERRNDSG